MSVAVAQAVGWAYSEDVDKKVRKNEFEQINGL